MGGLGLLDILDEGYLINQCLSLCADGLWKVRARVFKAWDDLENAKEGSFKNRIFR